MKTERAEMRRTDAAGRPEGREAKASISSLVLDAALLVLSVVVMAGTVFLISSGLALLVSPVLFFPEFFAKHGSRAPVLALMAMMLTPFYTLSIHEKLSGRHIPNIFDVVFASLLSLASPHIFLGVFRRLSVLIAGSDFNPLYSYSILFCGFAATIIGIVCLILVCSSRY